MSLLSLSPIVAGTMTLGIWGKKYSEIEIANFIAGCTEKGISTFDHADIYGDYTTEANFGKGFKASGIPREQVQFISKCGIQMVCSTRNHKTKHYDYSTKHIEQSVENSLQNLNTDYLDVLLLHRPSPLLHPEEVANVITQLKDTGKIKHFGLSNFTPSQTALLAKYIPIEVNQIEVSLTHHDAMFDGSLDHMMTHNIKPMAWSPLGAYFKESADWVKRIRKVVAPLAEKYSVNEDTLLLAWLLKHPSKITPVIGTTTLDRIDNALQALQIEIELQDWFAMLEASAGKPVA